MPPERFTPDLRPNQLLTSTPFTKHKKHDVSSRWYVQTQEQRFTKSAHTTQGATCMIHKSLMLERFFVQKICPRSTFQQLHAGLALYISAISRGPRLTTVVQNEKAAKGRHQPNFLTSVGHLPRRSCRGRRCRDFSRHSPWTGLSRRHSVATQDESNSAQVLVWCKILARHLRTCANRCCL